MNLNPIALFKEVESDLQAFGSVSTSIRDKVKGGLDLLRSIETDVVSMIDLVTGQAQSALGTLKAAAAETQQAVGATPTALALDAVSTIAAQHGVAPAVVQAAADAHAAPSGNMPPLTAAELAAADAGAVPGIAASIAQAVAAQAQPAG